MTEAPDDSAAPAASAGRGRTPALVTAVVVSGAQCLALLAYAVGLALSGAQNPGTVSAPVVEVAIYVVFAVGIALVTRGLWQRRRWARTPFVVVQLFGLVTAWTLLSGDGTATHAAGWGAGLLCLVGLVTALLPGMGESLEG